MEESLRMFMKISKRNTMSYSNIAQPNKGIEDFFPTRNLSVEELADYIGDIFHQWEAEMEKHITNHHALDMFRLYHLVEHTGYHLGQIVDRVKRIKGTPLYFCQNGINEKNLKQLIEKS